MPATSPEAIARKRERDRERRRAGQRNRAREKAYYEANSEYIREYQLRYVHGIGSAEKLAMLDAQHGSCYLCGDALTADAAVIDHDHRCCPQGRTCNYCRRGLACGACNTLIGLSLDDPERLRRIAANLEAVLAVVTTRMADKPQQLSLGFPEAS